MANDILELLDSVRVAVITGDYMRLTDLVAEVEAAEQRLVIDGMENPHVIKAQAERTAACLQGGLSGLKAARRRVADIRDATKGLTTYDHLGMKATLSSLPPNWRRV